MDKYDYYLEEMRKRLPIGKSFDVLERTIENGSVEMTLFFVDGLVSGSGMQYIMSHLLKVGNIGQVRSTEDFMKHLPFLDAMALDDLDMVEKHLYAGLVPILVKGADKVTVIDARSYPSRGVDEPEKEKTLRGAKDGFTEIFMQNIALIRRRIRDSRLIFESVVVGSESKTDTCLVYMENVVDKSMLEKLKKRIENIKVDNLTAGEQTIIEALLRKENGKMGFNPFPKVRYTQRPDVVAAHVTEGKIAVIVDNSSHVILLPSSIFDFVQDTDDYYFPRLTGNYFKLLRIANCLFVLFITPVYLLVAEGYIPAYQFLIFFIPDTEFAIPLFWQFILLELAVDGLRLASLNTPDSLGTSLSVIGALILGEFSVESGWFIPQTILCMAVVALAAFTQPSIELGYATKYIRILMLIGIAAAGFFGFAAALLIGIIVMASTKTLVGTSYLYPIIPFDGKVLKRVMFRSGR